MLQVRKHLQEINQAAMLVEAALKLALLPKRKAREADSPRITVMAIRAGVLGRMATLACSHFEHVISLGFSTLGFDLCINAFLRCHNDK